MGQLLIFIINSTIIFFCIYGIVSFYRNHKKDIKQLIKKSLTKLDDKIK